jgi:hypothetical protein
MTSQRYTLRSTHKMVRVRRLSSQVLALHRARRQVHENQGGFVGLDGSTHRSDSSQPSRYVQLKKSVVTAWRSSRVTYNYGLPRSVSSRHRR